MLYKTPLLTFLRFIEDLLKSVLKLFQAILKFQLHILAWLVWSESDRQILSTRNFAKLENTFSFASLHKFDENLNENLIGDFLGRASFRDFFLILRFLISSAGYNS